MRNRCQIVGTGRGDVRVMEQISLVSFSYQLFRNFETKIRINLRKDSRIYIYFLYTRRIRVQSLRSTRNIFDMFHIVSLLSFSQMQLINHKRIVNYYKNCSFELRKSKKIHPPPPIHQDNRVNERLFRARKKILIRGKRKFERERK